jgi:hypothetical protein
VTIHRRLGRLEIFGDTAIGDEIVTIDNGSRTPPLELPIAKWLQADRAEFAGAAGELYIASGYAIRHGECAVVCGVDAWTCGADPCPVT